MTADPVTVAYSWHASMMAAFGHDLSTSVRATQLKNVWRGGDDVQPA